MHRGFGRRIPPRCQAKSDTKLPAAIDTVRYFAYGANMTSSTLAKRDIKPLSACSAQLPAHHSIAFRHRGGYATIVNTSAAGGAVMPWHRRWSRILGGDEEASVAAGVLNDSCLVYRSPHGVLYELHRADMCKLAERETGYALRSAAVTPYAGEETIALLFTSQPLLLLPASVPPQRRYLELMLEGAQTNQLAPEYMHWLQKLPYAQPGSLSAEYFDTPSEWLARGAAVGLAACAAYYAVVH